MGTGVALFVPPDVVAGVADAVGAGEGDGVGATVGEAFAVAGDGEVWAGVVADGPTDGAAVETGGSAVTAVVVDVTLAEPDPAVTTVSGSPRPETVTPIWRSTEASGTLVHVRAEVSRGAVSDVVGGVVAATAVIAQAVGMLLT